MPGILKPKSKVKCVSIFDSPGLGDEFNVDSLHLDILKTPGSSPGEPNDRFGNMTIKLKKTEPVSPPRIKRTVRLEDSSTLTSPYESASFDPVSFGTPTRKGMAAGKTSVCTGETTQATSTYSYGALEKEKKKNNLGTWGKNSSLRKQIKHLKKALPKVLKSMKNGYAKKKTTVDLADLAVATICLVPRNGAGMNSGRLAFERMRTSLMLHMIQHGQNMAWGSSDIDDMEFKNSKSGKGHFAKLNNKLNDCIADDKSSFVQKSQEVSTNLIVFCNNISHPPNAIPIA